MRKKILFSSLLAILVLPISSQAERLHLSDVPKAVIISLQERHPDAKIIKIEEEHHFTLKLYEVKFKLDGKKQELLYTPQGKYFGYEEDIDISELPKAVVDQLKRSFKKVTIEKAEKIKHPDGRIEYEIDVLGDSEEWEIIMDPTGKVWSKMRD
jgi:hypothetical protein